MLRLDFWQLLVIALFYVGACFCVGLALKAVVELLAASWREWRRR